MKIIDSSGNDVTTARGAKWCIEMALNEPPRVTGLASGDRLCDDDGTPRFVASDRGTGYLLNYPPPWALLDAAFVSAGLEPCGPPS